MAILAQCPICKRKQTIRNKRCAECGEDLDKLKRQKDKVLFWIDYRLPGGKQRRERVGFSIEEARDAMGKRRSQKRENRIFDMLPNSDWNFNQLSEWYLDIESVKSNKTYKRIQLALNNISSFFGGKKVQNLVQIDIEKYQKHRLDEGKSPATIDMEIKYAKAAAKKAFINDKIDGRALRAFENTKLLMVRGSNARTRTITFKEYKLLLSLSPEHLKSAIIIAYHTGMRKGEILNLMWNNVDDDYQFIRLSSSDTKEKRSKAIPLNHHVIKLLKFLKSRNENDFVITCNGNPVKQKDALKRSLSNTCRISGIPYGRKVENGAIFHDLRRTFKSNMVQAGVRRIVRDTIVGHSLMGMDKHYIQLSDQALHTAIQTFTEYIDKHLSEIEAVNIDFRKNEVIQDNESTYSIQLRKELFQRGYRYRKSYDGLPGNPDIVFSKQKLAIFCNGRLNKFNKEIEMLDSMGWTTLNFSDSSISKNIVEVINSIENVLNQK